MHAEEKGFSKYKSIIGNAPLRFEILVFSRSGVNFIVIDAESKQRYRIQIPFMSAFQCIQSPDHARDYVALNQNQKNSNHPLWRLHSSQLQTETNDHENFLDKESFGSLYIKTEQVEIECIIQNEPEISIENQELLTLVQSLMKLR